MPTADYRCTDCDKVSEHVVTGDELWARCCMPEESMDQYEVSRHVRVWTPVSIGAVSGAGGSPARTGR